ncbi:MAG: M20/M25/M40 family metallo-hydrolase [Acidobacteria bacterium]|nr:M20/M25/M40 family metallo-hydrolase [Candidatus Sulfomarinibacter sp. MAG AM1]
MTAALTRSDWGRFAEKILLALENSQQGDPQGGTSGLEVEFNILDRDLTPVAHVGYGSEGHSFADYLYDERLPEWVRDRFQLEVFHWMTELTTQPCFSARATAAQARLLEGVLLDTLADIGHSFGTSFVALHGNIPHTAEVNGTSIPGGWNLARQRYLRRCVDLFGDRLATAGIHTNHSFPETLLSWDFFHLPLSERQGRTIEDYRNQSVIRATKLLRPMCPVFIAVSAASPFACEEADGRSEVVLTADDSRRLLAFPNPEDLDVPGLYASHRDYLDISYQLVRSGVRFGANNWTPVRARSDVDPVRRNITATSEQLRELYKRGIYPIGEHGGLEEAERALVVENLCARVDLPMNRVEVRTDEGGDDLELSVAKVLFKDLLMLRGYAEPECGAGYAYDEEDVARARRNEDAAARHGLDAEIEDPFGRGKISTRNYLGRLLSEVEPLAEDLGVSEQLDPLREMAGGGPNPAAMIRQWILGELGDHPRKAPSGSTLVPASLLAEWFEARRDLVAREVSEIAARPEDHGAEWVKLAPLVVGLQRMAEERPEMPIRLGRAREALVVEGLADRAADVLQLAAELVRIPSVTNCPEERVAQVFSCAGFVANRLASAGLDVRLFDRGRYPAVLAAFQRAPAPEVTLCGHFDVVRPEPDDSQFEPRVQGEYLWGRGAADMKTVVASYMVWMCERAAAGPPYPPFNLLLVGNEENGEGDPFGTPHVLKTLEKESGWQPQLMVVGERTGETGDELHGAVCTESRGILRMLVTASGVCGHTGISGSPADLLDKLVEVRSVLGSSFKRHLTLSSLDGWETTARFPFLNVGEPGVYNITAGSGVLGIEVRPIPGDDLAGLVAEAEALCGELGLEAVVEVMESGVSCPPANAHLAHLLAAVEQVSGEPAVIGKKKPGSSARFAPGGNQVVWGQTGIGPHSREERHFIPSIDPYLEVLDAFARRVGEG